ncbi:hypothetical protein ACFV9C_14415 [Kribbella sp. NPDC059898]|uniref:hypothetical protein n=1 Tax=Kribbella sp. NPDC059898 TaxID=3346995 RepID=UPI003657419F
MSGKATHHQNNDREGCAIDLPADDPQVPAQERSVVLRTILTELENLEHPVTVLPEHRQSELGSSAADFVVDGQSLRVLVKVVWDNPPTEVLRAGTELLNTTVEADAVILCRPSPPFPCVVIDAYQLPGRLDISVGGTTERVSATPYESVRRAVQELLAPAYHDWSDLPRASIAVGLSELIDPQNIGEIAASKARATRGRKVQLEAKKAAYGSLDDHIEDWVAQRVTAALAGNWSADQLAHDLNDITGGVDD